VVVEVVGSTLGAQNFNSNESGDNFLLRGHSKT